jgi:hypothetical protein
MNSHAAGQIELRKEYRKWVNRFWEKSTELAQLVTEEFPDPDDAAARPTRYHVDAMRDLALRMGELVEGHDDRAN